MNGLAVGQQYNTQRAFVHLADASSTADPSVLLDDFFFGMFDHSLNPLHPDHGAIGALAHSQEILGEFHGQIVWLVPSNSREKAQETKVETAFRRCRGFTQTGIDEAAAGSAGILPAGLWPRFPIRRQDAGAHGGYQRNLRNLRMTDWEAQQNVTLLKQKTSGLWGKLEAKSNHWRSLQPFPDRHVLCH